jgi:tripartite-type tricarboxylate transporter receptor subunit TctC
VSSAKRSSALPEVPTTLESGLADSDYNYWMGPFIPTIPLKSLGFYSN